MILTINQQEFQDIENFDISSKFYSFGQEDLIIIRLGQTYLNQTPKQIAEKIGDINNITLSFQEKDQFFQIENLYLYEITRNITDNQRAETLLLLKEK